MRQTSSNTPPLPLPMVICAVCRSWREVALNSPDLWGTIYVPLLVSETLPRRLVYDAVKLTNIWLARSKAAPLDIFLRVPNIPLAFDLSVNVILPKIAQHAHRLRRFLVLGDVSELHVNNVKGILTLMSNHMAEGASPQLHTLALKFQSRGTVRITDDQALLDRDWDYIPNSPPTFSVVHLSAQGIRLNPSLFPNLVSLEVVHLETSFYEFEGVFTVLPSLQKLFLPHLHALLSSPQSVNPIGVPSLHHLALSFHRRLLNSTSSYPVTHLRLPNLQSLALDGDGSVPICSCLDMSFISSMGNLNTLSLRKFVRFSADSASETTWNDIQFLHNLTTIKSLQLIASPVGNLLLEPFSTPPPARPRKRSVGHRSAISPHLAETHRTLEGVFQVMRINSARTHASPNKAVPVASSSSSTGLNWPVLETISMDSIVADDIVKLCQYVSGNQSVKTVCLSGPASRHLSHSVKRSRSDGTFFSTNFFTKRDEWGVRQEQGTGNSNADAENAVDWLSRRLQVLPFEDINCLHDAY